MKKEGATGMGMGIARRQTPVQEIMGVRGDMIVTPSYLLTREGGTYFHCGVDNET